MGERLLAFRTSSATAMQRMRSLLLVEAVLPSGGIPAAHRFCFQWQPQLLINTSSAEEYIPSTVTLAWSDYPAQLSSTWPLVNDLDLHVSCEEEFGGVVWGNGGTNADNRNTVEQVVLPFPRRDANRKRTNFCQASVLASRMPVAPQPYSLVFNG